MHPQRRKRLIWIVVLLLALGAAVALAAYALRQNINLFYTPTQLAAKEAAVGQRIQVGGLVLQGSVQRSPESLQVRFTLTDLGD
ncbi:MAG: cytochrome c biogenesis protein CcmE, partial [Acinetobacter sp.]|nr:cytochrome c biogenesis protein CcmE [Acinetobacter sp.]